MLTNICLIVPVDPLYYCSLAHLWSWEFENALYHCIVVCVCVCVKNVHTCALLCVWYQPFRPSQDYVARIRVGVRSKVMHGGLMKALVLATVCDLFSVNFLGDLINRYAG